MDFKIVIALIETAANIITLIIAYKSYKAIMLGE
jgi:hypothetical protein